MKWPAAILIVAAILSVAAILIVPAVRLNSIILIQKRAMVCVPLTSACSTCQREKV